MIEVAFLQQANCQRAKTQRKYKVYRTNLNDMIGPLLPKQRQFFFQVDENKAPTSTNLYSFIQKKIADFGKQSPRRLQIKTQWSP